MDLVGGGLRANAETTGAGSTQQRQPGPLPKEQLERARGFQNMNDPIDSRSPADATRAEWVLCLHGKDGPEGTENISEQTSLNVAS